MALSNNPEWTYVMRVPHAFVLCVESCLSGLNSIQTYALRVRKKHSRQIVMTLEIAFSFDAMVSMRDTLSALYGIDAEICIGRSRYEDRH